MLYNSPLEQFFFVPLSSASLIFNFSNNIVYLFISLFFLLNILLVLSFESGSIKGFVFVQNTGLFSFFTLFLGFIRELSESVLGPVRGIRLYSFISSLFFFIFILNFIGLIPYSFSVTAHLSATFSLSLGIMLGVAFLMFNIHGKHAFSYFLPSGTPFAIIPFIVPLELLSYLMRFVSLPLRLFANMMSGHILLKVFVGLSGTLITISSWDLNTIDCFFAGFFVLFILICLIFLEIGVALVQAYVFCLLVLIFLNDSYGLH
jgi:F-type H+-transporting ATPase subunit a